MYQTIRLLAWMPLVITIIIFGIPVLIGIIIGWAFRTLLISSTWEEFKREISK